MTYKGKLLCCLLFGVFFLLTHRVFAQGVLVSPPAQADDDGSSTEVLDASDQGGGGDHWQHRHRHTQDNRDVSSQESQVAQNPDLYLFGGEYDSEQNAQNYSHRGSESRSTAHPATSHSAVKAGGNSGAEHHKDDGSKKGETQ